MLLKIAAKLNKFQNSICYAIFVGAVILVFRAFALDIVCFSVLAALMCLNLLTNEDLISTLPLILMGVFSITEDSVKYSFKNPEIYKEPWIYALFVGLGIAIVASAVIHLLRFKKKPKMTKMLLPTGIFCLSMCIGGLFFKDYKWDSLMMALLLSLAYLGIYYFYAIGIKGGKDSFYRVANIMIVIGFVLIAQLLDIYLFSERFIENPIKGGLLFGWGVSNNMGSYLIAVLPFSIGLMWLRKRIVLNCVITCLLLIATVMSMSRTCIIIAAAFVAVMFIYFMICYKNKDRLRLFIVNLVVWGIIALIVVCLKEKFQFLLDYFTNKKLDDSGRWEIFVQGINEFRANWIFGTGIMHGSEEEFYTRFYHNTIIQVMACFGIVGLLAYIYHRAESVRLLIKNFNTQNIVYFLSIIMILINGLYDISTFSHHIIFIYSICLALIENNNEKQKFKEVLFAP